MIGLKKGDRVRLRASYCNWLGNVVGVDESMPYPVKVAWDIDLKIKYEGRTIDFKEGACLPSELQVVKS